MASSLNNGPVFMSFGYFPIHPFLSFLLTLCRFCTAAADRKLRLLTSDLRDKHEVKVEQYLELTGQKFASRH